jgi:hypothetical protein
MPRPPLNASLRRLAGLAAAAGLLATASPAAGPAVAAPTKPAGRITDRIETLFRPRLHPTPLPVVLPNPFTVVGGSVSPGRTDAEGSAAPSAAPAEPPPPDSDAEVLARRAAKLKIGGTIAVNGVTQLIINEAAYKEGDYVFPDSKDTSAYVQIVRLTPTELALGYREAVLSIRLKAPVKPPREGEP